MNNYIFLKLNNRILVKVWGNDSFKFLQNLTTNNLNKIIKETDFELYKNYPNKIFNNEFINNKYLDIYKTNNIKNKEVICLPSLFLLNNGNILFDCFIYNLKCVYDNKKFSCFNIDCNINNLNNMLDIFEKRKLSYQVYFKILYDINIYKALPVSSFLNYDIDNIKINNCNNEFIDNINIDKLLFFSKDTRHNLLGYRIYQINNKNENEMNKNEINKNEINKNFNFFLSKLKQHNIIINNSYIYDYLKLKIGIIENLYTDTFFEDIPLKNSKNLQVNENKDDFIHENENNSKKRNVRSNNKFIFKDFSPFDLNYDKLNYISQNKGCYVGQEIINRIRNNLLINKYELTFCINNKYYDIFVNNNENTKKVLKNYINEDKTCYNILKNINDEYILKEFFFLLKSIMKENIITFKNKYVIKQNINEKEKEKEKENNRVNKIQNNKDIIGNVFFYNGVIGICFLIKKKIIDKKDILYNYKNIYIESEDNKQRHQIVIIPFKYNSFENEKI